MNFVVESVEPNEDISLNSFTSCPVGAISWCTLL